MKPALLFCALATAATAAAAPLQPEIVSKIRDYLPVAFYAMPARASARRVYPLISATSNTYDRKRSLDTAGTEFALLELSDDGKRARLAFADAKNKSKSLEAWFKTEDVLDLPKTTKAEDTEFEGLCPHLHGANAIAISRDDATAPARIIKKHLKANPTIHMVGGVIEGKFYDEASVQSLADIPGREVLLGRLFGSMQSPVANFARVIKQITEKDPSAAAAAPAEEAPAAE